MGFCSDKQYEEFLDLCPMFEKYIVDAGIILIKYWLEVGKRNNNVVSRLGLTIMYASGNLAPWTWNPFAAGMNIRAHATACWEPPTTHAPWYPTFR